MKTGHIDIHHKDNKGASFTRLTKVRVLETNTRTGTAKVLPVLDDGSAENQPCGSVMEVELSSIAR